MEINKLIFLTGCVNPGGMEYTLLNDPQVRLDQYLEAIRFYIEKTSEKILFVENSNTDISHSFKQEIADKRIEILTFDGNNYDKTLGKGYGEMCIIEYAFLNSEFIRHADFIFKITGRLRVLNINSILPQPDDGKAEVLVNLQRSLTYSDSRCWGACKDFYLKFLLPNKELVNDSLDIHFENLLCKAVLQAIIVDYKFSFLNNLPRYSGISGSTNAAYNDSFFNWLFNYIKHKLRLKVLRK